VEWRTGGARNPEQQPKGSCAHAGAGAASPGAVRALPGLARDPLFAATAAGPKIGICTPEGWTGGGGGGGRGGRGGRKNSRWSVDLVSAERRDSRNIDGLASRVLAPRPQAQAGGGSTHGLSRHKSGARRCCTGAWARAARTPQKNCRPGELRESVHAGRHVRGRLSPSSPARREPCPRQGLDAIARSPPVRACAARKVCR